MTLIKAAASALVIAFGAAAFYLFVAIPYDENAVEHDATLRSDRAMRYGDPLLRLPLARHNLELIARYRERYPTVNLLMLDGWNRGILEDYAGAEQSYERAIALDARAETFVELGLAQMHAGKSVTAYQHLLTAGAFDRYYILDLPYPAVRSQILNELAAGIGYTRVLRIWKKDCVR
jgi:hypothetical protein